MPEFVVPVTTLGSKTIPVGVAERKEVDAELDLIGVVAPMSTPFRAPNGEDPPLRVKQVTTASPRPFVPRSGSIATAMGFWSTATVRGASVPMVLLELLGSWAIGVRSMVETVLEVELAMTARFVSWSIATPLGAVPTVTTIGFGVAELSMTGAAFTR